MSPIKLFTNKCDCCGCGACMNICPKDAINMQEDKYGFLYPIINPKACINCNKCKEICSFRNENKENITKYAYAAESRNDKQLIGSSSGGVFSAIASAVLERKGVIYGCSLESQNKKLCAKHIRVIDHDDLYKVQGSKYIQSYTGYIYRKILCDLQNKRYVLFSGTPCQVAALKRYLGSEQYDNLFLIDIICHGTPSNAFFESYIRVLEKKLGGLIKDFRFRDKTYGWGLKVCVKYLKSKNEIKKKIISINVSSYYKLFLDNIISRDSCYYCKYASKHRPGDLTIGDYWGIEQVHPEYIADNNRGVFDIKKGISCILANSEKGIQMLKEFGTTLIIKDSTFEKVARGNNQLIMPSKKPAARSVVLDLYKYYGYQAVDKWYFKQLGFKRYIYELWDLLPADVCKLFKYLRR